MQGVDPLFDAKFDRAWHKGETRTHPSSSSVKTSTAPP